MFQTSVFFIAFQHLYQPFLETYSYGVFDKSMRGISTLWWRLTDVTASRGAVHGLCNATDVIALAVIDLNVNGDALPSQS